VSDVTYSYRYSLFSHELTYELDDSGLTVRREGAEPTVMPFDSIHSVHLKYYGAGSYVCEVKAGWRKVILANRHYAGYGESEDRYASYERIVQSLHERLAPYAAGIRFRAGSYLVWGLGIFGMLVCMGWCVGLLVFPGRRPLTFREAVSLLLMLLVVAGFSMPLIVKGRAKSYCVDEIPPAFLPRSEPTETPD
jgi:hypothetical protein